MRAKQYTGAKEKRTTAGKNAERNLSGLLHPMLAKSGIALGNEKDYFFEYKWDGYRCITSVLDSEIHLYSRNGLSFNSAYPGIYNELKVVTENIILDGEVVALDANGIPRFQLLQNSNDEKVKIQYYLFDILYLNGTATVELPFSQRNELLHAFYKNYAFEHILISPIMTGRSADLLKTAGKKGLEGIMAKRSDGRYKPGIRSGDWIKIKVFETQSAVICGFTKPQGSRGYFGSLILGAYSKGKLKYIGHCGTGFTDKSLSDLFKKMSPMVRVKCPFEKIPDTNQPATWLKPALICEIKYTEWTSDGIMRHPVFQGLRTDLELNEVILDRIK